MSTWSARTRLACDQRRPDGFIEPCLLTLAEKVPTGPDWQFEVKHDGYRMIARVDAGRPRIWSRYGLNWTKAFPSIAESLGAFGRDLVLDGEAVCQLEDGSSDFHALAGEDGCARAVLWAFDQMLRTYAAQVEALAKLRRGGEQRVVVQHVNVNEGGQAIVGDVHNARGGGGSGEKIDRPHAPGQQRGRAQALAFTQGVPLWSEDPSRDTVSSSGREEQAPVPNARRREG